MTKIIPHIHSNQKKFAFLVHEPLLLVHYADVWKAMDSSDFTIILTENFHSDVNGNAKLGVSDFLKYTSASGYDVRVIKEIINQRIKFEYVVTNHVMSGGIKTGYFKKFLNYCVKLVNLSLRLLRFKAHLRKFERKVVYLPQQVGKKQIRFMYGADINDGNALQSWNKIYDIFLCHGVNDQREITKRFKGKTFIMGYPRYDSFFSGEMDFSRIRHEFGLTKSKKTLLWMPTLGGDYSSIPLFAEPLSKLNEQFNIIVRPHPISFLQEQNFISLLEKFNFNIDRNAVREMNELFGVADLILADNGGTPFSAIFLGKNVVFLDVPDDLGPESPTSYCIVDSSVTELKKHLPVLKPQEMQKLSNMLNSEEFHIENSKCIERLFKKYFDSPRGGGGKRVAQIFKSL